MKNKDLKLLITSWKYKGLFQDYSVYYKCTNEWAEVIVFKATFLQSVLHGIIHGQWVIKMFLQYANGHLRPCNMPWYEHNLRSRRVADKLPLNRNKIVPWFLGIVLSMLLNADHQPKEKVPHKNDPQREKQYGNDHVSPEEIFMAE